MVLAPMKSLMFEFSTGLSFGCSPICDRRSMAEQPPAKLRIANNAASLAIRKPGYFDGYLDGYLDIYITRVWQRLARWRWQERRRRQRQAPRRARRCCRILFPELSAARFPDAAR